MAMCDSCEHIGPDAEILIEFPSAGTTYEHQEYGIYAYDEYPEGSVNEGQTRRRFLDRNSDLETAQREHPKAIWAQGSAFMPVTVPATPPDWLDPSYAGESWDGE